MRTFFFEDSEFKIGADGNFVIVDGVEGLSERLDQRLKLFKGKYFMDNTQGVPYFESILTKPVDPGLAASVLNAEILKEEDVIGVGEVSVNLDPNTRKFDYAAVVQNSLGEDIEVTT
jgi:hypothetical protein